MALQQPDVIFLYTEAPLVALITGSLAVKVDAGWLLPNRGRAFPIPS